jgi:small-conductance mechanosensitive channel
MDINFLVFILFGIIALGVSYALFRALPRLIDYLFDRAPGFNRIDKTLAYFLSDSFGVALVILVVIYVLTLLPKSAALVAILITVASGAFIFTSEGWLGDALAGISLQLYPQYKIGDWVTLGGDKRGCVTRLGLFRTQLQTIYLDIISIKNAKILAEDIINHSGAFLRRLEVTVHTADYGDFGKDIHAYKTAIREVAQKVQDEICPEARELGRHPEVYFMEFGCSSDHIHVIFFTYDKDDVYGIAIDAMHTALAATLRPHGVILGQVTANTIDNVISFQPVKKGVFGFWGGF